MEEPLKFDPRSVARLIAIGACYPVIAVLSTFAIALISGIIINGLPRSEQNSPVTASWAACLGGTLAAQLLVPWLASFVVLRGIRRRLFFLVSVALGIALDWYVFDVYYALGKAWRRGW